MKRWHAIPLMFILFIGLVSNNNAFGSKWVTASSGDYTRYMIDLVVDPLPRTLESFGLKYSSLDSENIMSIETNAGPIMGLFVPRIIKVNVETGQVIDSNVPHKSWIYWVPANKQIGEKIMLDFGTVYDLSSVELTVKELAVKSFQNQKVDVYIAEGQSDGKTVSYIVEKNTGVVLEASVKDGNKSLLEGRLVETNVKMQEAAKIPIEEPPEKAPTVTEEPEKQPDISVAVKYKKKLTLVAVKNNGDEEILGFQLKFGDGNIRFAKAGGWDRDRIDESTVIFQTEDRPLKVGMSLIIMIIVDNKASDIEWTAFGTASSILASGALIPK